MAKQTLPVNFKDDILDPSMSGKRKYRLIDNGDGTVSFEDVTTYTQAGSDYGAGQINATNQAVNESCDKADVIDDLDDIMANQSTGKIAGANAVKQINADLFFKSGDKIDVDQLVVNGYITYNKSRIYVTIPVGKRLDNIKSARTNNVTGVIRQNGNYLVGSASDSHGFAQNQGTFNVLKDLGVIRYQYDFSGPISAAVNNDTISLQFTGGVIQLL